MRLKLFFLVLFHFFLATAQEAHCKNHLFSGISVEVDARVELLSLIFRLAGLPEYNHNDLRPYVEEADLYFSKFKNHSAIKLARHLSKKHGVRYDAVMSLAVRLNDSFTMEIRDQSLDPRWPRPKLMEFIKAVNAFVIESDFNEFLKRHEAIYSLASERLIEVLNKHEVKKWFDSFFGVSTRVEFKVIIGMLIGPGAYGPSVRPPNGKEQFFCIIGAWKKDKKGIPLFNKSFLPLIIHEFCHSYANPIVDRHAHDLANAGKKIFPHVAEAMNKSAYTHWKIMMYETFVRAFVIRNLLSDLGMEAASRQMESDQKQHFFWTPGLSELLDDYECNRDKYPDIEAFFPRIKAYLDQYADKVEAEIKAVKNQWEQQWNLLAKKAPKVKASIPANNADGVDPNLKTIQIIFDRPMWKGYMAILPINGAFPSLTGRADYDATRSVLNIPVKLAPDTEYKIALNSKDLLVFRDEQGNPLMPYVLKFRTK